MNNFEVIVKYSMNNLQAVDLSQVWEFSQIIFGMANAKWSAKSTLIANSIA